MAAAPLPAIPDLDRYTATRDAAHALAEQVLAAARHRGSGHIGLRATPGGFGTPPFGDPPTAVRVAGTELVVERGAEQHAVPLTTVADAASTVGIEPGAPADVYTPVSPFEPERPLALDHAAMGVLAAWFAFGTEVLDTLRAEAGAEDAASDVTLWPEHFDLGVDLGDEASDARGTFGASPGDAHHAEPYLYAMPWRKDPTDPFWTETSFTGATLLYTDLVAADDPGVTGLEFLRRGRAALGAGA